MGIDVRPATVFDDVRTMVGPKRPDANVCWCLSYRIPSKENAALRGPERGARVEELVAQDPPPGVLAYVGTRALFEKAGFTEAVVTDSVINGFPRLLMRLDLR